MSLEPLKCLHRAAFGNWHRTLASIFTVAFLARLLFCLMLQEGFYFPDSIQYSNAALNLLSSDGFGEAYDRAPGYPAFLAVIYFLLGDAIFTVRLVESVMGALLAVVIAVIGKRIGGETVGALSALLWSLYPMAVFIAGLVYPTGLTAMLLACGAWCMLPRPGEELSKKGVLSGGFFLGLAALTIPVALLTIGVIAAWVFYWAPRRRILLASVVLFGAVLAVGPWTARSFFVRGELVAVQPVERHVPRIAKSKGDAADSKIARILQNPGLFAAHFGRQFLGFWQLYPDRIKMSRPGYREKLHERDARVVKDTVYGPGLLVNLVSVMSTGPVILFGLIGAVAMWLRRELRRDLSMLLAMIFSFAVGYSLFVGKIRYRIPVEPYVIILSAYGLAQAWLFLAKKYAWLGRSHDKRTGASPAVSVGSLRREGHQ